MSALVWPFAVVCFDLIVFSTAVFLVRLAARDRFREVQELEPEESWVYEPTIVETPPDQGMGHIPAMG